MLKKLFLFAIALSWLNTQLSAQDSLAITDDSLRIMIGQMILIGVGDGDQLDKSNPVFESIAEGKVGSIILFEKNINFESPKKNIKAVINHAQKNAQIPLFVSIDEEGGKVNRLKTRYGFPKTVTAQYLGSLNNIDSTRFYAENTAQTLYNLGFNINFAPAVDLNINPKNPAIGKMGRSYSENAQLVFEHAKTFISVHDQYNIGTTLKHFPGHGSSQSDTHLGIADVSNSWSIEELYPYKALLDSGYVRAIMTAHIINRVLDESKLPATLSQPIVSGILRGFLGYDGVIFSDDMQMQAIANEYGLEEAIRMSIIAGVDILLFANNVPNYQVVSANQVFDTLYFLVKNGDIQAERVRSSFERIMLLKKELGLLESNYKSELNTRLKRD